MTRHVINPTAAPRPSYTPPALDVALFDRRQAEADLDQGLGGILVEPLLAIAGGIMGGVAVTALAWRLEWSRSTRRATIAGTRRLRRNLAGRP